MHRLITGALPGQIVDHINRDTLDNRRNNLRIVTTSQNGANSKHRKRISGFRGVYPAPHGLPWAVFIQKQYIGKFQNKEDAARAFDLEAIKRFGECAVLNFEDSK
jgi:hypothetical protein